MGRSLTKMVFITGFPLSYLETNSPNHLRSLYIQRPDPQSKTRRHSSLPWGRGEGSVSGSRQGNAGLASKLEENGR